MSLKFAVCRKRDSKSFSYSVCSLEWKDNSFTGQDNSFTGQITIQRTDYCVSVADCIIRWYTAFHRFDHLGQQIKYTFWSVIPQKQECWTDRRENYFRDLSSTKIEYSVSYLFKYFIFFFRKVKELNELKRTECS